jgi:hypothetical protein
MLIIVCILLLLLLAILYIIGVIWVAKKHVATAPRADLFICDKHGAIMDKHVLRMEVGTEQPILYCPLCFNDRMTEAKQKAGVK